MNFGFKNFELFNPVGTTGIGGATTVSDASAATAGAALIDVPGMTTVINTSGESLLIIFSCTARSSGLTGFGQVTLLVDGALVQSCISGSVAGSDNQPITLHAFVTLAGGSHTIQPQYSGDGVNTFTLCPAGNNATRTRLSVCRI